VGTRESTTGGYREDLAYIHDAGFGGMARAAAPILIESLRRRGFERGLVVDLGCGSGILSEMIVEAGYEVLGIDLSPAMIVLARARVPGGTFRVESLLTAKLPSCIAVAAVGECFNYAFDPRLSRAALASQFRQIHHSLKRGGLFLFDVAEPGRVPRGAAYRVFVEAPDWAAFVVAEEDSRSRRLTRRITSFRRVGALYRRDQETHELCLIPRQELTEELRKIGFRVRILHGYGPTPFPQGLVGYLARKS
jgi:SAM-dependent methyltransferase